MLLNNLAKSFNDLIKEARGKPVLTMVEEIRWQIMARFQQKGTEGRLSSQFAQRFIRSWRSSKVMQEIASADGIMNLSLRWITCMMHDV
jgi:hypothetical protein